jgi:hypothetical protein
LTSPLHPRIINAENRIKSKFKATKDTLRFIGLPLFRGSSRRVFLWVKGSLVPP